MADVRTKFVIDGEQQFRSAINQAKNSMHALGSELTLAAAQFKKNGDAQALMASRTKTLKAEIEQQTQIVEANEAALRQAEKQYGKASDTAKAWQADLNKAQAKLLNLQKELENNNNGLDKNGKAFDTAAGKAQNFGGALQSVDKIQKGITFQSINTALNNLDKLFVSVGQTAAKVWKAVWNNTSEAAGWAVDVGKLSQQLGISAEEIQQMQYAAKIMGVDFGEVSSTMKNMVNPTKEYAEALHKLGVNRAEAFAVVQENGAVDHFEQMRSASALYYDAIEKVAAAQAEIDKIDTYTLDGYLKRENALRELDATTKTIFGKSLAEMQPILQAGAKAWQEYGDQAAESGDILGDDLVSNLQEFNKSMQQMQADYEAFQKIFAAELAPGLKTAADAMSGFLTELNQWAQTDQGKAALTALSDAISTFITTLAENIDFSDLASKAAEGIETLTGALNWFSEHGEAVSVIIAGIATAVGTIKVTKGVLSFLTLLKLGGGGIKNLFGGGGADISNAISGGDVSGGAETATESGGGGWLKTALAWGKNAIKSAAPALGVLAAEAAGLAIIMAPSTMMDALATEEKKAFLNEARNTALLAADDGGKVSAAKDVVYIAADAMEQAVHGLGTEMGESISAALDTLAGTEGASNISKLINLNRLKEGGYGVGAEYDLLGMYARDALKIISDPEAAKDAQDLAAAYGEMNAVIKEADTDLQADTPERVAKIFNKMIENDKILSLLPEDTLATVGEYLTNRELYGRKGSQFYTDEVDMLRLLVSGIEGYVSQLDISKAQLGLGYNYSMTQAMNGYQPYPWVNGAWAQLGNGNNYSLASVFSGPTLENISDFMDLIIDVQDSLSDGYTIEGEKAMYDLINSLKDSNLRTVLSEGGNSLLDKWFDLDSGFGSGSAGMFVDSQILLSSIFDELQGAWDAGMQDTTAAEEAGKATSGAAVVGLLSGLGNVTAAAQALASAVVSALSSAAVPAAPRGAVTTANNNYNNSSSMYISTFNNYSPSDVDGLMMAMDRQNKYQRMGRGA